MTTSRRSTSVPPGAIYISAPQVCDRYGGVSHMLCVGRTQELDRIAIAAGNRAGVDLIAIFGIRKTFHLIEQFELPFPRNQPQASLYATPDFKETPFGGKNPLGSKTAQSYRTACSAVGAG